MLWVGTLKHESVNKFKNADVQTIKEIIMSDS
jgi:hypothetical protein